ncbi:hypothetical protein NKH41_22855 [Mesorhizobium sp. M1169]|uniref:hypothetical protein n=1 Tax=Mesorhizobium sp. M1169 TaxID=2957066 RepID=UPI003339C3B5
MIGLVDEKHHAIVCVDRAGRPTGAFTSADVTRYIATRAKELDGLIALTEHKVSHLIESIDIGALWASMDEAAPVGLAVKALQKPRIQVLVGIDVESGKATGVILRAHRRY